MINCKVISNDINDTSTITILGTFAGKYRDAPNFKDTYTQSMKYCKAMDGILAGYGDGKAT